MAEPHFIPEAEGTPFPSYAKNILFHTSLTANRTVFIVKSTVSNIFKSILNISRQRVYYKDNSICNKYFYHKLFP